MRTSVWATAALFVTFFAGAAQAVTVNTEVDTEARKVTLSFTDLPPYEQIRLEGVTALYWCNCVDLDNPLSLRSTGFTVNADRLEMQYEGQPPPSTNYITYHYLDEYAFTGLELADWIVVTPVSGDDVTLTADRPILMAVPEPSGGLLCSVGLATLFLVRRSARELCRRRIARSGRAGA